MGTEAGGSEFSLAYAVRPCLRERFIKRGDMNVLFSGRKMAQRLSLVTALAKDKKAGDLPPLRIPAAAPTPGESDASAFVPHVRL